MADAAAELTALMKYIDNGLRLQEITNNDFGLAPFMGQPVLSALACGFDRRVP